MNFLKLKLRTVPFFWSLVVMMTVLWVLMAASIFFNYTSLRNSTAKRNLQEMQGSFRASCDRFSNTLYSLDGISVTLTHSYAYNLLRGVKSDSLPPKYITAGTSIRDFLALQSFNHGNFSQFGCYFSNINTVISKNRIDSSEDFFSNQLYCSETDNSEILSSLKKSGTNKIYPCQKISFGEKETPADRILLLTHPKDSPCGFLFVYDEEEFLRQIIPDNLPGGSFVRLEDSSGSLIDFYSYKTDGDFQGEGAYSVLSASFQMQPLSAFIYVPDSYFSELLAKETRNSLITSVIFAGIGFLLIFLFSNASASPIQQIVSDNRISISENRNELSAISNILRTSLSTSEEIKQQLICSQLIRLFSGSILMEREIDHLNNDLSFRAPYRIAVIQCSGETDFQKIKDLLSQTFDNFVLIALSRSEAGVLCSDTEKSMEYFLSLQKSFTDLRLSGDFSCGISNSVPTLNEFLIGLRQARAVSFVRNKVQIYRKPDADKPKTSVISWIRHEQFHQSILSEKKDTAFSLLMRISSEIDTSSEAMVFNELLFVILSAAEELSLKLSIVPSYNRNQPFSENVLRLSKALAELFDLINCNKTQETKDSPRETVEYINQNYMDSNMCIQMVSNALGIKEAAVNEILKKKLQLSFSEYLLFVRMKKAAELLKSTDKSISDIYIACGYTAESTFFRLFKQYYGVSPKKYRDS